MTLEQPQRGCVMRPRFHFTITTIERNRRFSTKHLHRYVNEFEGRHNGSALDTIDQMAAIVQGMMGRRLRYIDLIGLGETRLGGQMAMV